MATLTNTQIKDLMNQAYNQFTGNQGTDSAIDLSAFDTGMSGDELVALKNRFTKELIAVCTKNWFMDTSYRGTYNDPFYEDSSRFGAITQMISATVPEVKENSAWNSFESGVTKVGQYTVYLPVVDTRYYAKSESWALPITISGEQWDTAFRNESELGDFVAYIFMMVDNAIVQHMEDLNNANRNHFIAEKIHYATSEGAKGVHVVNLVELYCQDTGKDSMTVEEFLSDADALRNATKNIGLYEGYLRKQTSLFNTEEKVRFVPKDREVVQLLGAFVKTLNSVALSNTFHKDMLELPLYSEVPAWQSMNDLSFDKLSSINVKLDDTRTVAKSGIVGLMCDKWAIVHTIKSDRVGSQHFSIENLTHYEYQHRDQYINNLTLSAIVFTVEDVIA